MRKQPIKSGVVRETTRYRNKKRAEVSQVVPASMRGMNVRPLPNLKAGEVVVGDLSTNHNFAEVTQVVRTGEDTVTIKVAGGQVQSLRHRKFPVVRAVR